MNTQAIAQHLNLAQELILEVQEWAHVLWVRIKGMRSKFVSKKVAIAMITKEQAEAMLGMPIKGWDEKSAEYIQRLKEAGYKNSTITPRQRMEISVVSEIESHYAMDSRTVARLAMVAAILNGQSLEFVRGY